jgi:hypothetical protein
MHVNDVGWFSPLTAKVNIGEGKLILDLYLGKPQRHNTQSDKQIDLEEKSTTLRNVSFLLISVQGILIRAL